MEISNTLNLSKERESYFATNLEKKVLKPNICYIIVRLMSGIVCQIFMSKLSHSIQGIKRQVAVLNFVKDTSDLILCMIKETGLNPLVDRISVDSGLS